MPNTATAATLLSKKTLPASNSGKKLKLGIRSSATYELVFEDCRVPAVICWQGRRWIQTDNASLNGGRAGIAAQGLGIAEGAFRFALDYALQRQQFASRSLKIRPSPLNSPIWR
jgi:alkylation response protein AidB-like acyl-CoA dehydrogenase